MTFKAGVSVYRKRDEEKGTKIATDAVTAAPFKMWLTLLTVYALMLSAWQIKERHMMAVWTVQYG